MNAVFPSFALAFGLSAALVPLCRVLARRFGVVAHPRDDRWHRTTVPLLGGLALALALAIGTVAMGLAR
jgi:UDP-GlcNAc:undecaprenyl-phosphate GlcNAc-1-phosphate transferase